MINIRELIESKPPKNGKFYLVAIDGRGASGKSSLLDYLKTRLEGFIFLNFDDYFEPREDSSEWGFLNRERFAQDVIEPLKTSAAFTYRPYSWHSEPHINPTEITVKKGLCLEGFSVFSFDLNWDLKIWVEASKEICLQRGVARDADQPNASHVWRNIWQPQEDKYIERIQPLQNSDLIIDGTKLFNTQVA